MNQVKWLRIALMLLLALGLAMPAFAVSDSQEPGSVIVFPKFIAGTVAVPPDGVVRPRTEIEVGVVCPKGVVCPEGQNIKLRFHWVCPGDQTFEHKYICEEVDFDVFVTVFGKRVFNPDGNVALGNVTVPPAPCDRGYLIGWVINTADQPIKFDGLIGDAVLRESPTAVSAYNAIPIQADPALASGAIIRLSDEDGLIFDDGPGHYKSLPGVIYGDVLYDNVASTTTSVLSQTFLTLLTLDVRSNRPNLPTFVDLKFYNENERLVSTFTEFICWEEVSLSRINRGLIQSAMGSRKGVVVSGQATKEVPFGLEEDTDTKAAAASDRTGQVTLLGIVETLEYGSSPIAVPPPPALRAYSYSLYNNSKDIPTIFFPGN